MTTQTLTYRFTLDAFKHGVQRVLQGFQTGESVSRKMEISISAGADPFELPTNNLTAVMYVKRPSQDSPSINACSIDALNNKIIYQIDATDIQEAGIVMMQLKLINTIGEEEAVICSPIFGMEVWESQTEDSDAEGDPTYTALTEALAAATRMKDSSIADLYIDKDTNIFTVVFGDGSVYTSDVIADAVSKVDEFDDKIEAHIQNKNNPHEVTFEQIIGLSDALDGKSDVDHTHTSEDVTDLASLLDGKANASHSHAISDVASLQSSLDGKAASSHSHAISDVTGLQTSLNGKAASSHSHNISDVTNLQSTLNNKVDKVTGKGLSTNDFTDALKTKLENITPGGQQAANWGDITGNIENQTDLQTALNGKAPLSHSHAISDVTNLQTALNSKAASSHSHAISDVTGLQTSLNGKAASSHSHAISDVTGLQTSLNGKAASSHSHAISDVTGLQTSLDGKATVSALSEIKNIISSEWSSATTYIAGNYCWYNSKLWKCLTQNSNTTPAEGTYWTEVDVGQELFKAFSNMKNIITGVLTAGQTSITINDNSITTDSIIEPFFSVAGGTASAPICYTAITVSNGSVTMAFEALDADLTVGIRVIN